MTETAVAGSVGGAFELDVLSVAKAAGEVIVLGKGVSVTSGRTALALAVEQVGASHWLLPAYLCASVLQPMRAATEVAFYSVGDDLEPRLDDLERAVRDHPHSAILVIDYFGFPPGEAAAIASAAGECTIVEDCVQGSLVETPDAAGGRLGSVSFTSFRKFLPVPDGGVVRGLDEVDLPPAAGAAVSRRLLGQLMRGAHLEDALFLQLLDASEQALDDEVPRSSTSLVTRRLLADIDLAAVAVRRRANFAELLSALAERDVLDVVSPLRTHLPTGVSPLVLPVRIKYGARDAVRAALHAQRVFCPVHWKLPEDISPRGFPEEHALSREILGLPIDQRYGAAEMIRVADAVLDAVRATR